jgi:16S rRNA (guanine(966)-N(2))-methyltransferase RsmD
MLRIIAGRYKGRRLKIVPLSRVRPLPARLRESLFGILQSKIRDALFLDGFAGTGSAGIEALSRGASRAVFVEELPQAARIIQANLRKCEAEGYGLVINREFNRAVIDLARKGLKFDLIFLDPPYRLLAERNPLKVVRKRGILKPEGLLIIRHHRRYTPSKEDFRLLRQVDFGDDVFSIYTGEVVAARKSGPKKPDSD